VLGEAPKGKFPFFHEDLKKFIHPQADNSSVELINVLSALRRNDHTNSSKEMGQK